MKFFAGRVRWLVVSMLVLGAAFGFHQYRSAVRHYRHGQEAYAKGDYPVAIAQFKNAAHAFPWFAQAGTAEGYAWLRLGKIDQSRQAFLRVTHIPGFLNNSLAQAYVGLGYAAMEKGELADALSRFSEAGHIDPKLAEAKSGTGYYYLKTGDLKSASDAFKQALQLNPSLSEAYTGLGYIYFYAAQASPQYYPRAVAMFDRALQRDPDQLQAAVGKIYAYGRMGRYDEAMATYQSATAKNPYLATLPVRMGYMMLRHENYNQAHQLFETALKQNPNLADAHTGLGYLKLKTHQPDQAKSAFDAALKINPVSVNALTGMAQAVSETGHHHEDALPYLEKAAATSPSPWQWSADRCEGKGDITAFEALHERYKSALQAKDPSAIQYLYRMEAICTPVSQN